MNILSVYLLKNIFHQFINSFSSLLDKGEFSSDFFISRSSEILIESNFWLGMYVPYIFKGWESRQNTDFFLSYLPELAADPNNKKSSINPW